jgi:polysaccharide pyruvyl transferase WcaK-like protein
MKLITALAWVDNQNVGDESYKLAFPILFPHYKWHFTNKLTAKNIAESDAIVLGGGDIMSDAFLDQLVSVSKPKHIISASCTDKTDISKLLGFQNIIVRDLPSVKILKDKGIPSKYSPDAAFCLQPDKLRGKRLIRKEFAAQKRDLYAKTVAVVMNGYLADAESNSYDVRKFINFHKLAYDLGHVIDYTPASFIFLPFGQQLPWDDRAPNIWVAQKCKFWNKNVVVWEELGVQSVLDIISAADATISTRLHSTIFSIVGRTPFIDITHNHKNAALLETIEKQHASVRYEGLDGEHVQKMLKEIIWPKESKEKELQALVDKQRALLKDLSDVHLA